MEYLELAMECAPMALSIIATVIAFKKGKTKTNLTEEQVNQKVEKYKQKLFKKNKLETKSEFLNENIGENNQANNDCDNISLLGR